MSDRGGLYVIDQPGPGPLTVLVHGSLDRSASFTRCRHELSELHVVVYDRRGYGRSIVARPPATTLADHVDDLLTIIGGGPAVVAGHSLGGDVALGAAAVRPDVVRAVACWEAPMPWLPQWPSDTSGGVATEAGLQQGPEAAAESFFRHLVGEDTWNGLPERTRAARRAEGTALLTDLESVRAAPFDLGTIAVPVVVGRGSRSKPHHVEAAVRLAQALPDAELMVIDGAAHGAHASHPAEFASFVRRAVVRSGL